MIYTYTIITSHMHHSHTYLTYQTGRRHYSRHRHSSFLSQSWSWPQSSQFVSPLHVSTSPWFATESLKSPVLQPPSPLVVAATIAVVAAVVAVVAVIACLNFALIRNRNSQAKLRLLLHLCFPRFRSRRRHNGLYRIRLRWHLRFPHRSVPVRVRRSGVPAGTTCRCSRIRRQARRRRSGQPLRLFHPRTATYSTVSKSWWMSCGELTALASPVSVDSRPSAYRLSATRTPSSRSSHRSSDPCRRWRTVASRPVT